MKVAQFNNLIIYRDVYVKVFTKTGTYALNVKMEKMRSLVVKNSLSTKKCYMSKQH